MGEIAIPDAVPQLAIDGEKPKEERARKSVGHIGLHDAKGRTEQRAERMERMRKWFKEKAVAPTVASLIGVLLRDKPDEPIPHLVRHILSQRDVPECPEPEKHLTPDGAEYLKKKRIIVIFEELLNNMFEEEADDIAQYALTWFRWNKKRFPCA